MLDPRTANERLGLGNSYTQGDSATQAYYDLINLKFAARGLPVVGEEKDFPFLKTGRSLLANFRERVRLLSEYICPADQRIDRFLREHLADCPDADIFPFTLLPDLAGQQQDMRHVAVEE